MADRTRRSGSGKAAAKGSAKSSAKSSVNVTTGSATSANVPRAVLCFGVTLVTYWCISGSLFHSWPQAQCALVVGVSAGLIGSLWVAGASASAVMLLGTLIGPHSLWSPVTAAFSPIDLVWLVLAGVVGAGVAYSVSHRWVAPRWLFWGVVAFMVVNLWVTATTIDSMQRVYPPTGQAVPSVRDALGGDLRYPMKDSDEYLYFWLVQRLRTGADYYSAFAAARPTVSPGSAGATSVLNFREPLLYIVAAKAPGAWLVLDTQLLLVTGAAFGVTVLVRDAVKLPTALPGVAAVLAMGVYMIQRPLYAEGWAGPLCLIALALVAVSSRSGRWRWLITAAAATAALAFLVRELALVAIVAGLVAAWFSPAEQRAFRMRAWIGALAVAIVGYGVHYWLAVPHLAHASVSGQPHEGFALFAGGPAFALRGLVYGADVMLGVLGVSWLVPGVLAVLGIVGSFLLPEIETRIMAAGTIVGIFVLGLVAGNGARYASTGGLANYWGAVSAYIMYACMPVAFSLIGAARPGAKSAVLPSTRE